MATPPPAHQDWETVVLHKRAPQLTTVQRQAVATGTNIVARASKPDARGSDDAAERKGAVPRVLTPDARKALVAARVARKQSQTDLDRACAFPPHTTQKLEAGALAPTPGQLSVLSRVLHVSLTVVKPPT